MESPKQKGPKFKQIIDNDLKAFGKKRQLSPRDPVVTPPHLRTCILPKSTLGKNYTPPTQITTEIIIN